MDGALLELELVQDGRVISLTRVEVADLSGRALSRRIREFAFDGPCRLDGLRLIRATGAFRPAGVNYTVPVDLLETSSVTMAEFRPLPIVLGADKPLPRATSIGSDTSAASVTVDHQPSASINVTGTVTRQPSFDQLERSCVATRSNLRTGPGTDHGIQAVLGEGEVLYIQRRTPDGRWNQIITPGGIEGWVYFTLIRGC
ncbi:MAG: hypothetical protein CMF26_06335 [Kiloniella sp.]|nr:hypothetical protein [Kiloniella sp.]